MARKKQETLTLFPEVTTITRKFTNAQFGELMRAAFSYRFQGEEYTGTDAAVDVAFQALAAQIDRYQEFCDKQSNNAKGSQVQPNAANDCQDVPSAPPSPCPSPCPSPNSISGKPPTRPHFSQPTLDDVAGYCAERGNQIDPQRFVDYYTANGWRVGKNPMRNWKAAVRNWERRAAPPAPAATDENYGYVLAPLDDPWETATRGSSHA